MRKRLKREYNRDKTAYEEYLTSNGVTNNHILNDYGGGEDMNGMMNGIDDDGMNSGPTIVFQPVEVDYKAVEEERFGELTKKLAYLQTLSSEVFNLTDRAMQTLRYACMNISQKVSDVLLKMIN